MTSAWRHHLAPLNNTDGQWRRIETCCNRCGLCRTSPHTEWDCVTGSIFQLLLSIECLVALDSSDTMLKKFFRVTTFICRQLETIKVFEPFTAVRNSRYQLRIYVLYLSTKCLTYYLFVGACCWSIKFIWSYKNVYRRCFIQSHEYRSDFLMHQ